MTDLLKNYKYKIELHAHTSPASSCSEIPPQLLVENYAKLEYDSVTITNHFEPSLLSYSTAAECAKKYLDDFNEAYSYGKQLGINVILGMEIRFAENINDYLVYGIDGDFIEKSFCFLDKGIKEFYSKMKNDTCVILQAHPFRNGMVLADPNFIDGIESYNVHPNHNSRIALAVKYANENNFIVSAGTDYHHPGHEGLSAVMSKNPVKDSYEAAALLKSRDYIVDMCGDIIILKNNKIFEF